MLHANFAATTGYAAYDLRSGHWVYWNAETQYFDLQELAPGYLILLLNSPFKHIRTDREASTI